ncbi:MAG: C39 family peptidase [bacterium]|nr:C39 family peptidase [bacterium]
MAKQINKIISGAIIFAVFFFSVFLIYEDEVNSFLNLETNETAPLAAMATEKKEDSPPSYINIAVPFSSQAPFGDWSQPWQDACEEVSVMMAVAWARGWSAFAPELVRDEILNQVAFERRTFDYHRDTNAADTARILKEFYHYKNVEVRSEGISVEAIKKELASGNIVVLPLAGALLKNPYFTTPPPFHMVVVRGYDDKVQEFITNEPGTRRGDGFRYGYENLFRAIHDWTGSEKNILDGKKAMIVVSRPVPGYR